MKRISLILITCLSLQFCSSGVGNKSHVDNSTKSFEAEEYAYGGSEGIDDDVSKISSGLNEGQGKQTDVEIKKDESAPLNKKIIKNAEIKIKVKDVNLCTKTIEKLSSKYQGYITSSNINSYTNSTDTKVISKDSVLMRTGYTVENNMTIRIPTEKIDIFLEDLEELSVFTHYKNITAKDVTEEFIDITTRLKTKKEVEKRYIEILRTKAQTVKDILETEEKLRILREEIEAAEGKLRYLSNKVNFSTINLALYQDIQFRDEIVLKGEETTYEKGFFSKISDGLEGGWNIILYILIGLTYVWPFILLGLIVGFIFYRKMRKND